MSPPTTINETIEWVSAETPPNDDTTVLVLMDDGSVDLGWKSRDHWHADMSQEIIAVRYWAFLPLGPKVKP